MGYCPKLENWKGFIKWKNPNFKHHSKAISLKRGKEWKRQANGARSNKVQMVTKKERRQRFNGHRPLKWIGVGRKGAGRRKKDYRWKAMRAP